MVTAVLSPQQIREAVIDTLESRLGILVSPEFRHVLAPHPKEKLVLGGIQSGKSTLTATELLVDILTLPLRISQGLAPDRPYLYWIVMPSYMMPTKELHYLHEWSRALGFVEAFNNPQGAPSRLVLMKGLVTVETRTAQDPAAIASEPCDGVVLAEAGQMGEELRERALERTITRNGWCLYTGTLEDDSAKPRYAWYGELGRQWLEHPTEDGMAFSLPTWANRSVHPEGRNSPRIIAEEKRWLEGGKAYMFNRRIAGIPDGNPDPVYIDVQVGEWGAGDVSAWTWIRSRNAGGHDWGDTPGHPSTLAAVTVSHNDVAVVRDVWEQESAPVPEIETRRHLMSQRWNIPRPRWGFDPMLQRDAKTLGVQAVATGKGSRKRRVGLVEARLKSRRLLFDMDVQPTDPPHEVERKERVRRAYHQMQRVHWNKREVPGEGIVLEYARVDDDMVAAIEDAVEVIDSGKKWNLGNFKAYSTGV